MKSEAKQIFAHWFIINNPIPKYSHVKRSKTKIDIMRMVDTTGHDFLKNRTFMQSILQSMVPKTVLE